MKKAVLLIYLISILITLTGTGCNEWEDIIVEPEAVVIFPISIEPTIVEVVWTQSTAYNFRSYEVRVSDNPTSCEYGGGYTYLTYFDLEDTSSRIRFLTPGQTYCFYIRITTIDKLYIDSEPIEITTPSY